MSDKISLELTRRRALGAVLTIGAGSAAAGAGTFALFSDTETSSGNTVQAGTLNLTDGDGGSVEFSFGGSELKPGGNEQSGTVTLVSDGSIDGSLDIDVSVSENDGSTGTPGNSTDTSTSDFAKALELTTLKYGGTDISGQGIGEQDPFDTSSYTSLYDLANNKHADDGESEDGETTQNDIIDLADPGDGTDFELGVTLRSGATNEYQGDGVDATVTFTLNQQDSQ